ncbi:S1 family peptidase [Streptococcus suis]
MKQNFSRSLIVASGLLLATSFTLVACTAQKEQTTSAPIQTTKGGTKKGERQQITDIASSQYNNIVLIQSKMSQENFGTGSFISPDTLITNRHVLTGIEKSEDAVVRTVDEDGQVVDLPVKSFAIPEDESMDVGIVKLQNPITSNAKLKHITPLTLADVTVTDSVKEGQFIRTVGYPGDKEYRTLWDSQGTIIGNDDGFLSFTAPFSRGASGSPLFNDKNQFIGLANAYTDDPKNPITFGFLFDSKIRQFIERNM